MDEETRRRCLEPFFTTKGQRGTGLGLAMVYGTMQRHGGSICAGERAGGQGTTFTFLLPVGHGNARAGERWRSSGATRPLNILAVDDQEVLTEIVAEYLAEDLHHVETAFDGSEAMAKFRAGSFDLVITDMAMPGMGGEAVGGGGEGDRAADAGDPADGLRDVGGRRAVAAQRRSDGGQTGDARGVAAGRGGR